MLETVKLLIFLCIFIDFDFKGKLLRTQISITLIKF